jgi:hypothetical protein
MSARTAVTPTHIRLSPRLFFVTATDHALCEDEEIAEHRVSCNYGNSPKLTTYQ